jgi:hypothetical protein
MRTLPNSIESLAARGTLRGPLFQISDQIRVLAGLIKGSKKIKTPYGEKTLDTSFEIPYLAGYNKKGDTIYIDKRLNPALTLKDGRKMDVIKYLIVHESVEKHLEDEKGYKYPFAHEKATGAERKAVEDDGYPWDEYQKYALSEVKRIKEIDPNVPIPEDYDDKPERDTRDYGLLKVIRQHQKP